MRHLRIFNRPPEMLRQVIFDPKHWLGIIRILFILREPFHFLTIYLTRSESHMSGDDFNIRYRYKGKNRTIAVRGPHDYSTFFEVYCRRDYAIKSLNPVVLDIGSNVGITARYYLENVAEFIYLYEPNLENLNLLRKNIEDFAGRYALEEKAIAISSGMSTFEFDSTGRYGRLLDVKNPEDGIPRQRTQVDAMSIVDAIDAVLINFKKIDILKIDIEGLELEIVKAIPQNRLAKIKMIQYETWPKGIVTLEP